MEPPTSNILPPTSPSTSQGRASHQTKTADTLEATTKIPELYLWSSTKRLSVWKRIQFGDGQCLASCYHATKTVALFKPGKQWKKLCLRMTVVEGNYEARLQFLLQLFIVFSRSDREPSTLQIASLTISLIMIVKSQLADFLKDQPGLKIREEIRQNMELLPMFHTIGSTSVAMALLKYWFPFVNIGVSCGVYLIGCCTVFALMKMTRKKKTTIRMMVKMETNIKRKNKLFVTPTFRTYGQICSEQCGTPAVASATPLQR